MGKNFKTLVFAVAGILALSGTKASAAPATPAVPSSPAAPASASASPPAVAAGDVVGAAVSDSTKLRKIQSDLQSADRDAALVKQDLGTLTDKIQQQEEDVQVIENTPTLSALRSARNAWERLASSSKDSAQVLNARTSDLDKKITELGQMDQKWKATLASTQAATPPDVLTRIKSVIAQIEQTTRAAKTAQSGILSTQDSLAIQDARITAGIAATKKAQDTAVHLLFVRNSVPLWGLAEGAPGEAQNLVAPYRNSFASQLQQVRSYLAAKFSTVGVHLLIFILFAVALFWVRKELRVKNDPALHQAQQVLDVPFAIAAVLALSIRNWIYPGAPHLFQACLGAAVLLPAVIILRRIMEPSLLPVLYAMVICFFVDQVRYAAAVLPLLSRCLLLLEIIAAAFFLLWLLRSKRLSALKDSPGLQRVVRIYARLALAIFCVAGLANVLGYTRLSYLMGSALLSSGYLAVILYAAVRILDGLILAALKIAPFSHLGMVRRHAEMVSRNIAFCFRGFAFLFWLRETLELFWLRDPIWEKGAKILTSTDDSGHIFPSLAGRVCLFVFIAWATFFVSKFLRFILEEEVYPHLKLGRGVPYAASTMVHYAVLIAGFLVALNALGIDLAKYTVLAGALGVGLGFGLQNIMNNFVSGVILLFERPIKVGDVIQVDTAVGTVENIGIRASVIRITDGSEIIMPNGNLISNNVTNWTFSNRQRVIAIPVTVGPKADPLRIITLLVDLAKAQPLVLKEPAPQALLTTFNATALNFELRVWTNSYDAWMQVRSDLGLAISGALTRENIPLS